MKISLKGLDCAHCASKIENSVKDLVEIKEASLNFSLGMLMVTLKEDANKTSIMSTIKSIVNKFKPDVIVSEILSSDISNDYNYDMDCDGRCFLACDESTAQIEDKHNFLKENLFLIAGIILYFLAILFQNKTNIGIYLFFGSYVLVGGEVLLTAIRNILKGEVFDENFLMSIATIGALAIGQYPEAVAVMIFYKIGELFQGYAVNKSRKSITSLMNIRAEYANILINEKEEKKVVPQLVSVNDIIIIKPGERVPLDGIVIDGEGSLDTSALTGESLPREVSKDNEVLSGSINLNSVLKVRVTKSFGESTVSRILEMVENASSKKAKTEKFITQFSKYYTPIVVFLAIAIAVIPPFIAKDIQFSTWIYRALSFLVVSCPCALVVSIPLGLFSGIGGASKKGILVKGGNYIEALKNVHTVVFDKTGTLTKGTFKVSQINNVNIDKDELLRIAAIGESFSNHPIAQSIVKEYGKEIKKEAIKKYEELSGYGVKVIVEDKEILLGNYKLMKQNNIICNEVFDAGTIVYISCLLYTSPSPRDLSTSRMPSSA
eukprot:TRINITY_DN25092_c0_g1_i13.p2 TRINITY_DN25092_c0_g1~~TRINITY_DN25092_c0_g1_i13.p2  ORF type:complete len:548 (-),score=80.83 TRINITY_DN25092_c0_g1_i13:47-1690(-)